MKIRRVMWSFGEEQQTNGHLVGSELTTVDLVSAGKTLDAALIYGKSKTGKSLICNTIVSAFQACLQTVQPLPLHQRAVLSDTSRSAWDLNNPSGSAGTPYLALQTVEFDCGTEIASVTKMYKVPLAGHMSRFNVSPSSDGMWSRSRAVEKACNLPSAGKPLTGCVLHYPASRHAGLGRQGGLEAMSSVLHDIHVALPMQNCVILVDDLDLLLDPEESSAFFDHLRKHCLAKRNQLICTSRSSFLANHVREVCGEVAVLELPATGDTRTAVDRALFEMKR